MTSLISVRFWIKWCMQFCFTYDLNTSPTIFNIYMCVCVCVCVCVCLLNVKLLCVFYYFVINKSVEIQEEQIICKSIKCQ